MRTKGQVIRPLLVFAVVIACSGFHLKWQREDEGHASGTDDQGALTIYAALPEQAGLKVDSGRRPVNVLVVDNIYTEQPTGNSRGGYNRIFNAG